MQRQALSLPNDVGCQVARRVCVVLLSWVQEELATRPCGRRRGSQSDLWTGKDDWVGQPTRGRISFGGLLTLTVGAWLRTLMSSEGVSQAPLV